MTYLLLVIGTVIGLYALYRYVQVANMKQIGRLLLVIMIVTLLATLVYMTATGRLVPALALAAALATLALKFFNIRERITKKRDAPHMTRAEALEILELSGTPDKRAIQAAYKRMMTKFHPDQGGSQYMARKLNAARDLLLKQKPKGQFDQPD